VAVTTADILLEGIRRDKVFDWLGDPTNHACLVEGAFDSVTAKGTGEFELSLSTSLKKRTMGYRFDHADDTHGGRRVHVETTGKRTRGKLHYSLRTMKPSTNTLVTCHIDYDPGSMLGAIIDSNGLNAALETSLKKILENLAREIPRS